MSTRDRQPIIVVSGLPRSGTSLMMQILQAGGIPVLSDSHRPADINNPRGYFEYQQVKRIRQNQTWVKKAIGKAVKIVSPLLPYLPSEYNYLIIFMRRPLAEIIASQERMLKTLARPQSKANPSKIKLAFQQHLQKIEKLISQKGNIKTIYISYPLLIRQPKLQLRKIRSFLGPSFSPLRGRQVIDPHLYRQTRAKVKAAPGL